MSENHYELIGRTVAAWNRIDMWWQEVFATLIDAPREQADAIFLSLASPKAQADLVRNLARLKLDASGPAFDRITKGLDAAGKLVGLRNNAAHARYMGNELNLSVDEPYRYPPRETDFVGKGIADELASALAKIKSLESDVWAALAATWVETGKQPPFG